ncbi:MAG TPA: Crp/Fnr family transcriptional regulator [Candidatus Binatia bacterium]|jgi:CRP-like cAMP-binding protein|nr:Crp/Fnr family transcriptional regulator [Candidatus Binatia bacterium]
MKEQTVVDAASLRKLPSLSWLSSRQLEKLIASMAVEVVESGKLIFNEWAEADLAHLLVSGIAKISFLNHEDKRVLVGLVKPGDIFGISFFFPKLQRPFRCDAFMDCTVGIMSPEAFVEIFFGIPLDVYLRSMELAVGRWRDMFMHCTAGIGLNLRKRLALELLELGNRFGVKDSRGTILSVRLTHEDLADMVGASRQKVTEHIKEFERQSAVLRQGRQLILIPQKLQEIVQPAVKK